MLFMAETPGPPSVARIVPSAGRAVCVRGKSTYEMPIFAPFGSRRFRGTSTRPQMPPGATSHQAGPAFTTAGGSGGELTVTARRWKPSAVEGIVNRCGRLEDALAPEATMLVRTSGTVRGAKRWRHRDQPRDRALAALR